MKILWLTNFALPFVAKDIGMESRVYEGWLIGLLNNLRVNDELQMVLVFPQNKDKHIIAGEVEGITYFGYYQRNEHTDFDSSLQEDFVKLLDEIKPDIIHIMGTEFPHCYSMVKAAHDKKIAEKVVISIQGLVSVYTRHYMNGLPMRIQYGFTLRDFLKRSTLHRDYTQYKQRGEYEIKSLRMASHVIGRTDWDYACAKMINPKIEYHFNNETLRPEFYQSRQWEIENCKKYSIFISQATKPIKGFHYMLQAFAIIKKRYPEAKLYVAGSSTLLEKKPLFMRTIYTAYIENLIEKLNLRDSIIFCGTLTAFDMVEYYLKAHVFVSASSIENSPNSLGEAMILGTPVVSSYVGGIANLLEHGKEGFLYQADAPYMLANYVMRIFHDDDLAAKFSCNAREKAHITHDGMKNAAQLMSVYKDIQQSKTVIKYDNEN